MSVLQTGIASTASFYPYAIDQSLRFNDDDSTYLSRTPATAGNRKTWTFSAWVKTTAAAGDKMIFASRASDNSIIAQIQLGAAGANFLAISGLANGVFFNVRTAAIFRDPSSWYHILISVDTTQSTASNRIKIYINGEQQSSFDVEDYPDQNTDTDFNRATQTNIGSFLPFGGNYFDGYLAEINFIDGQALDPTSFGEFKSGVWVAKEYTGTYGTNGFYLPFENGLGNDESGNGNDWTPNNLAATDIVLDSPTNNFATLNPLDQTTIGTSGDYSQGNLKFVTSGDSTSNNGTRATMSFNSRKWYWEYLWNSTPASTYPQAGILRSDTGLDIESNGNALLSTGGYGVEGEGSKFIDGSASSSGISWSVGDIVQVAVDMDNKYIYIGKNGTWQFSGVPTSGASGTGALSSLGDYYYAPIAGDNNFISAATIYLNFGQDSSFAGNETAQGNTDENGIGDFYYTPPAGFLALCTANLPEPAISSADDESPSDYFNTVLYTGNGTSQSISGVGFHPDWVWIKSRNFAAEHVLIDSVRGTFNSNGYEYYGRLFSNQTNAEDVASLDTVISLDTDGVSVNSVGGGSYVNDSSDAYVAWNWKAGGAGVTNTDGSITSTVSASPESGFSIVSYTGNGLSSATVGHGLGAVPNMIITKARQGVNADNHWYVYHSGLSPSHNINLSLANGERTVNEGLTSGIINTSPSSTTFGFDAGSTGVLNSNESGTTMIAYCFAEVEGYSKFGSYTGNGSSDGPFVYTGFRPAFVIFKRTDTSGNWLLYDNKRNEFNFAANILLPNLLDSEQTGDSIRIDMVSNGIKLRGANAALNTSGGTYIYMAFAENPFKFSNAR